MFHKLFEAAGKVLNGKQVANVLAENYENESDLHVDPLRQRKAKNEKEKGSKKSTAEKMKKEITLYELLSAIKMSKLAKKAPGEDKITNQMIKNLGNITSLKLLEVSNLSWKTGTVPQVWPTATMIPIYKKGKDKKGTSLSV